ncbi:MAG: R3H domain-containing nucleic acid-binding protein [Patescibacteria group bacterium]
MDESTLQIIEELTRELLEQLEVKGSVVVSERDEAAFVLIETEDAAPLIGRHGKSLEAIQILLGQMVHKKVGTWIRVIVSVGDYRERRELQLKELAQKTAERVVESGQPAIISDLSPSERRVVHMVLTDHPHVQSESDGVGRLRKLIVKPRV